LEPEQLKKLFNPDSIAVIGASNRKESVGHALMENLVGSGFEGTIYPVNTKRKNVMGIHCYKRIQEVPVVPDLAIIAIPAKFVPGVAKECIERGTKAFVVLSAGFGEIGEDGKKIERELMKIIHEGGATLMGPNCLGFIRPGKKLNASFATRSALSGNIALISQSGALCSGILDWALKQNVGFKYFVSVGAMIDLNFSDLIDFFAKDPDVKSIVIYMESIKDARKFMSAARAFARNRPILIAKSGKYSESAKAAISHTGSLAGNSEVFDAAFKRAGIIRVDSIQDMFNTSEAISKMPLPKNNRLAVVTNAGGPGVMAADAIIEYGCRLAKLSKKTMEKLEKEMPMHWSRNNPVDILGDSQPDRFRKAVEVVAADENVDGIVVLFAPQAVSDPLGTAKAIIEASKDARKPILAGWIGEGFIEPARQYLRANKIPDYRTPEEAVRAFNYLYSYWKNHVTLYETPKEIAVNVNKNSPLIRKIIDSYRKREQFVVSENDSKKILAQYGIPVNKTLFAKSENESVEKAKKIGFPVVMKLVSDKITHKSDVGGIELNLKSEATVRKAFKQLKKRVKEKTGVLIDGVSIQRMIKASGPELIIGSSTDPIFGPVVLFGGGGTAVELYNDKALGLPPLNQTLAEQLIEETKISKILKGYRGKKAANLGELQRILMHFSRLIADYPEIKEVDMNPVIPSGDEFFAVDARIVLDKDFRLDKDGKNRYDKLAIKPYPEEYIKKVKLLKGESILLRPIMPEDETRMVDLFNSFSKQTIRHRFFHMINEMNHESLMRYCFNDYDREIALVGETGKGKNKKLTGVVRIMLDLGLDSAEFAIVITDYWQKRGLGTHMLKHILAIAREKGITRIWGHVMSDNAEMISLFRKENFTFSKSRDVGVFSVEKHLE